MITWMKSSITKGIIQWLQYSDQIMTYTHELFNFQFPVWVTTAAGLLASILLINTMEQLVTFIKNDNSGNDKPCVISNEDLQSLQNCTWLLICVYLRQGGLTVNLFIFAGLNFQGFSKKYNFACISIHIFLHMCICTEQTLSIITI